MKIYKYKLSMLALSNKIKCDHNYLKMTLTRSQLDLNLYFSCNYIYIYFFFSSSTNCETNKFFGFETQEISTKSQDLQLVVLSRIGQCSSIIVKYDR